MFDLLDAELLEDTPAIREQVLQFMSLVAPQYDGLRERVEKELGKTVVVLRQQALEVLDKKGEGGDEINLLRELAQKNRGR